MKPIADNLRITKPDIQKALEDRNPVPIHALVQQCEDAGAFAIDINTGPLGKAPEKAMPFFIKAVEEVTTLPLLIDTSNPVAMQAGLEARTKAITNRPMPIINGFSLEPKKLEQILPLAKQWDTDIVGFLLYPDSRVPKSEAERFEIALELMGRAESAGLDPQRIILDPIVPPLVWEDGIILARAVVNTIRMLPEVLGFPVRTIAGISNLVTGERNQEKRLLVEQNYMAMLASAGLTYALMNVLNPQLMRFAKVSSTLVCEEIFSFGMV
jgi:5-methyltetrahydrofolate corrinoid/iron sulfur protein methyltransferase